jgi:hypothetical protein
MKTMIVITFFLFTCIAPQGKEDESKENLSPQFAKAALKALIAARDGSDTSVDAAENAETEARTDTEQSAFRGIQRYSMWRSSLLASRHGSPEAKALIEKMVPGACFAGLKEQYLSRIWQAIPEDCNEYTKSMKKHAK